jgi:hypothetical protein
MRSKSVAFTKLPGSFRCPPSFTFGRQSAENAIKSQCIFFPLRPSIFSLSTIKDRFFQRKRGGVRRVNRNVTDEATRSFARSPRGPRPAPLVPSRSTHRADIGRGGEFQWEYRITFITHIKGSLSSFSRLNDVSLVSRKAWETSPLVVPVFVLVFLRGFRDSEKIAPAPNFHCSSSSFSPPQFRFHDSYSTPQMI